MRAGAATSIRSATYNLQERAERAERQSALLRESVVEASTYSDDVVFTAKVAMQVAYALRTDTLDVHACSPDKRVLHVVGGQFGGDVANGDNPTLTTSNPDKGVLPQTLQLNNRGLTVSAFLQLTAMYGVRADRDNTPTHLVEEIWGSKPEVDVPDFVNEIGKSSLVPGRYVLIGRPRL